jgi:type VI secretion system Hcp family effector
MERLKGVKLLALGVILIIFFFVGACSKNTSINGPDEHSRLGTVTGEISYSGAQDFGGIKVTLEKVTDGLTAKIAALQKTSERKTLADSEILTEITDSNGGFSFENIPFGDYSLIASQSAESLAKITRVAVTTTEPVEVDIVLTATANIIGTVLLEGLTDHSGVLVYIAGTSYMATTDADGSYRIANVPLGSYEIHTSASEYLTGKSSVVLDEAGEETAAPVITLQKTGVVMGIVVSATSIPLAGVTVQTLSGETAISDSNGIFIMNDVPAGSALMSFTKAGFDVAWVSVTSIQSGELTTLPNMVKMYASGTTPPENMDDFNRGYSSIYCRISDIDGEVSFDGMDHLINVYNINYEISNSASSSTGSGAAAPVASPIVITKHIDKSSPYLWKSCTEGRRIMRVELFFYRMDEGIPKRYYVMTMEDVLITDIVGKNFSENKPFQDEEVVSFTYRKIKWENREEGSPVSTFQFDFSLR